MRGPPALPQAVAPLGRERIGDRARRATGSHAAGADQAAIPLPWCPPRTRARAWMKEKRGRQTKLDKDGGWKGHDVRRPDDAF